VPYKPFTQKARAAALASNTCSPAKPKVVPVTSSPVVVKSLPKTKKRKHIENSDEEEWSSEEEEIIGKT
jgi:hypothetical protein